jgi:hypothetical protein
VVAKVLSYIVELVAESILKRSASCKRNNVNWNAKALSDVGEHTTKKSAEVDKKRKKKEKPYPNGHGG